jgi:alginate O-acetyltransferase complex protein AlgI
MLFNSLEFIFLFLPIVVLLHFALARISIDAAVIGTATASLVFYAWWNPPFVLLPMGSIVANFTLARWMAGCAPAASRRLLIAGIVGNVLVLCYYKYADFLISIYDGHRAMPPNVPLALSFTTFVQIAFLAEVHRRRLTVKFSRYALFVAFFPHLIAGPIVRWSNLGRQLDDPARYRVDWDNIALGLTIFVFGLVKKVLISDPLARPVAAAFDAASAAQPFTAFGAWGAAVAFMCQIYFDFSGYSDMAVGLGLLFNYRLPINFAAPLRATNLFDFWRRWHITLMRFLRDFVYAPLGSGRPGPLRRSVALMTTMVLAGLWHGAGWTFIAFGAYHGALLLLTMFWQYLRGPVRSNRVGRFFGWAFTITAVAISGTFFRAADMAGAWHLLQAMAGFGDATALAGHSRLDDWMIVHGYIPEAWATVLFGATWSMAGTALAAAALGVALFVPDTMEIVGYKEGDAQSSWRRPLPEWLAWRPSPVWLRMVTALFIVVFINLGRVAEFLYYQF